MAAVGRSLVMAFGWWRCFLCKRRKTGFDSRFLSAFRDQSLIASRMIGWDGYGERQRPRRWLFSGWTCLDFQPRPHGPPTCTCTEYSVHELRQEHRPPISVLANFLSLPTPLNHRPATLPSVGFFLLRPADNNVPTARCEVGLLSAEYTT